MRKTAITMGMTASIEIVDEGALEKDICTIFDYFNQIDNTFSTYKPDSEITQINRGGLLKKNSSSLMKKILTLSEETKKETDGYFDIHTKGMIDPSGIVKGYAIHEGSKKLKRKGYKNFSVEIAGDVEVYGIKGNRPWRVGIENPFNEKEIIKIVALSNKGMATSGTYKNGLHIYNPHTKKSADEIASVTIIGQNAYEADRFATAIFAMGKKGMLFLTSQKDIEGYMVTKDKKSIFTDGFEKYVVS